MIFQLVKRSASRYAGYIKFFIVNKHSKVYSGGARDLPVTLKSRQDFDRLFMLLFEENQRRSILGGTRAVYPGKRSRNGADIDAIEGCSRFMPMAAAFLKASQGNQSEISALLVNYIKNSLVTGTHKGKGYWGEAGSFDQLVVEMADIALAIWLSKGAVWSDLSEEEKRAIVTWLKTAICKPVFNNNWLLFVLLIEFVLKDLGECNNINVEYFSRVKSFHLGGGWFKDGHDGSVDYYNAWAFNYSLYWINQIDPCYEKDFILEVITSFPEDYKRFFDSRGCVPMYGRSVCYRMAVYAPLLTGSDLNPSVIHPGEAGKLLSRGWEYFIANGAVDGGRITQGFFSDDERFLDEYSGPASPMWSLRSLIVAYYISSKGKDPFQISEEPLEIESGDYDFKVDNVGLRVVGDSLSEKITLVLPNRKKIDSSSDMKRWLRFFLLLAPLRKTEYRDVQSVVVDSSNDFYRAL